MSELPGNRPSFHFTVVKGWINDPHGVTFRQDGVHVFFQHVPESTMWSPACHWGHAVSSDLVTWDERPTTLSPGDGDIGCWTGCVVPGTDVLFYTAVSEPNLAVGRIRSARPSDASWTHWVKGDVVVALPDHLEARQFRDPVVWRDGDCWRMVVAAGLPDAVASALTYTSADLASWCYDGVFAQRPTTERAGAWTGSLWECPQIAKVGDEQLLVVSTWFDGVPEDVAAAVGRVTDGRFTATSWQPLTFGRIHYAATVFVDDDGEPGLLYWLRDVRDDAAGWAGALSVPYRVALQDGRAVMTPHPRLATSRGACLAEDVLMSSGGEMALLSWHCEVVVTQEEPGAVELSLATDGEPASLVLATSPEGSWLLEGTTRGEVPRLSPAESVTLLVDRVVVEGVFPGGLTASPLGVRPGQAPPTLRMRRGAARLTVWDRSRRTAPTAGRD